MKRLCIILLLVAVSSGSMALAKENKEHLQSEGTSHEIASFNYMEQSGDITVMVYSYPAYWRKNAAFFPLVVAVGVASRKGEKPLHVMLNNFVYGDAQGNTYPNVEPAELEKKYKERMSDQNIIRESPMSYGNHWDTYERLSVSFYPGERNMRLQTTVVELNAFTWFANIIYFPTPKGGFEGLHTLKLEGGEIEPPIEVKFRFPLK